MKKTILIGATVAVVIATVFVYAHYEYTVSQAVSVSPFVSTTTAVLVIDGSSYSINVSPGETVLDLMRTLSSTGGFTFTGREYSGLGFFVDAINGRKNEGGKYWVFYINGISAPMGVSATLLHANDLIEWKYEKGY